VFPRVEEFFGPKSLSNLWNEMKVSNKANPLELKEGPIKKRFKKKIGPNFPRNKKK